MNGEKFPEIWDIRKMATLRPLHIALVLRLHSIDH